ncbi:MAG: 2,3-bisphosphoglycerate-independent phosphoglycerate mutase [Deltaproteobacteria bacterium]|nr:2,3-bisphosphoglycerate-independent phosphoglycerate mutase [Deltaproteobacteria bacterium]
MMLSTSVLLIVLDGFGINKRKEGNAIALAKTPTFDKLYSQYLHTRLDTSGRSVGLPEGQMGNSEVGHLNLGAGRIVPQDLVRIDRTIEDGTFFENPILKPAMTECIRQGKAIHLMGLCSNGGVHSSIDHMLALCRMASRLKASKLYVHAFTDGRDTAPGSAPQFIHQLQETFQEIHLGTLASLSGRFYAMDRDNRWDRTELAYRAIAEGMGLKTSNGESAFQLSQQRNESDEFMTPLVIDSYPGVEEGDLCIFANYRADRARQLTRAFTEEHFTRFDRGAAPRLSNFVCMTMYDETFPIPVAFPPLKLTGILSEVLGAHGKRHLHIAESEKYAHVTYFFNGGDEREYPCEERCIVSSPRHVGTYDQCPEMSAGELTQRCISYIKKDCPNFIIINYANPDMVGHTGSLPAAIEAIETVDRCIGDLLDAWLSPNHVAFITADHGNAELMIDPQTGKPHTAHTTNLVPFIAVGERFQKGYRIREKGILADVMPTILEVMDLPRPKEVTGESLLIREL